jgi:hypothetical protein
MWTYGSCTRCAAHRRDGPFWGCARWQTCTMQHRARCTGAHVCVCACVHTWSGSATVIEAASSVARIEAAMAAPHRSISPAGADSLAHHARTIPTQAALQGTSSVRPQMRWGGKSEREKSNSERTYLTGRFRRACEAEDDGGRADNRPVARVEDEVGAWVIYVKHGRIRR